MSLSGIKISSTFRRATGIPLDLWYAQETLDDRDNIPSGVRYEGMPVYVIATQMCYKLVGGIENIHWVRCDSGIKNNLQATVNPTASNNESEGYSEGSFWYNIIDDDLFILTTFVGVNATWISIAQLGMIWTIVEW